MGYDHFFINETKKQIVSSKALDMDYEDGNHLLAYLRLCCGDTIRIVGEEDQLVNSVSNCNPALRNYEYKYIELFSFDIRRNECGDLCPENELQRLYDEVNES